MIEYSDDYIRKTKRQDEIDGGKFQELLIKAIKNLDKSYTSTMMLNVRRLPPKHSVDRKDFTSLSISFGCLGFIIWSIWSALPRPLSAASATELAQLARDSRNEEIRTQMIRRYVTPPNLNYGGPDILKDADARWQEITSFIEEYGVPSQKAQQVAALAREKLGADWPILAERGFITRGYFRNDVAWIIISSSDAGTGGSNVFCGVGVSVWDRKTDNRYTARAKAVIISADAPYQVLN